MSHILFVFGVLRGAIVEVLTAGIPTGAAVWEITSYESWQWGALEEEGVVSGLVLLRQASKRPKVRNRDLS